jgi:hypothetical protein
MKSKVIMLLLGIITIASLSLAYYQKSKADIVLIEMSKLRKELKQSEQRSSAARIEASKLRFIIENEKRRTEEAIKLAKK